MHKFNLNRGWRQFIKLNLLILSVLFFFACKKQHIEKPALIPMPQKLEWNGEVFKMTDSSACFVQHIVPRIAEVPFHQQEAYRLHITADSVILEATTAKGLYWGQQTIRQIKQTINGKKVLQGCEIIDWPAFSVRGFMQDVGRNYQSIQMLKEQIDVLSAYKMNTFHLHLTDNPGWRLESKIYSQLKNPETMSRWPGKYYSQEQFVELSNYCAGKNITLIPEFDVPGHSQAFREAFELDSMSDPSVRAILLGLIDELCSLLPPEQMPFIHIGTDEVWHAYEKPDPQLLSDLIDRIQSHGREVIVWRPGIEIQRDTVSITQLWSSNGHPKPGHRFLDSRLNYLNHLDPLAGVTQLFFERIGGAAHGDSIRLGGILCCWNDNNVNDEYDIIKQNPVYPGILTYAETSWTGQENEFGETYLAKLPEKGSELFNEFSAFEDRMIQHRDKYFTEKPFPYIKQANIEWKILGPIANDSDVDAKFPVENTLQENYQIDTTNYTWQGPFYGGTIHLTHFFGYPSNFPKEEGTYYAYTKIWSPKEQTAGAWIGFHDWSRSGGRRGGPFPKEGEWHNTQPKVWLNGKLVDAPKWNNPGVASSTEEIPFSDENYFFRKPSSIHLNKGWNEVLLKIPVKKDTWKRMFTFIPVQIENENVKEVPGLKYNSEINFKN